MINPGLERRGHVEVTHRGGDDDLICGEQLRDEFIGDLEGGRMLVGMFIGSGESAGDLGHQRRKFRRSQVASDDLAANLVGLAFSCEVIAEFT